MELPRVTEILNPFTGFRFVKKDLLESAAERGTKVHGICAKIAEGLYVPDFTIDEELQPYVKNFNIFMEQYVKEVLIVEERYQCTELEFTGQVDMVIMTKDDRKFLVDLKTGISKQKSHAVQMAAYRHLLDEHDIQVSGAMLVYLARENEPEVEFITDLDPHWEVFKSALNCYNYFFKRKKK
jgi:hypothetical protein